MDVISRQRKGLKQKYFWRPQAAKDWSGKPGFWRRRNGGAPKMRPNSES
jgi:hypothetical protein